MEEVPGEARHCPSYVRGLLKERRPDKAYISNLNSQLKGLDFSVLSDNIAYWHDLRVEVQLITDKSNKKYPQIRVLYNQEDEELMTDEVRASIKDEIEEIGLEALMDTTKIVARQDAIADK
jgi:hypothetical protein